MITTARSEGIITGLKARVAMDRSNMQTMQRMNRNSTLETARRNRLMVNNQPYYTLKRDIDELRRNNEELNRTIQREIVETGQPLQSIVIVRDPARPVMRPVSPKTYVIIPFGIVVGLLVGISLAFFIEYLDTSVKTIDDVEHGPCRRRCWESFRRTLATSWKKGRRHLTPRLTACCAPTSCSPARMKAGIPFPC